MPAARAPLTRFERVRNVGVVGLLALGFALTLAIFAEGTWARPACAAYATSHQLTYIGLEYPSAPPGVPGRRAAACLFIAAGETSANRATAVPLADVASSRMATLAVEILTVPLLTTPILVLLFVLLLYQIYGAMGLR